MLCEHGPRAIECGASEPPRCQSGSGHALDESTLGWPAAQGSDESPILAPRLAAPSALPNALRPVDLIAGCLARIPSPRTLSAINQQESRMSSSNLLDLQSESPSRPAPRPRIRWWSRVLVPAILFLSVALLLIAATWQHFVPAQAVRVETAIAKQVGDRARASSVVQAAGWPMALPRKFSCSKATL